MRRRWLPWIVGGLVIGAITGSYHGTSGAQQQSVRPSSVSSSQSFINQYCSACHNDKTETAGLDLTSMDVENPGLDMETWEKVVRKLQARAMPPVGVPGPDENAYQAFLADLQAGLDRAAEAKPNPGRTETFHRLNRTEYQNAIRDLLALEVDDVVSLLPKDNESYGFDNVNVGALPPSLMERYVDAARKISQRAIGTSGRSAGPTIIELAPDLTQEEELEGMPLGTRGGTMFRHTFPMDGEYEIEIRLSRDRDEHIEGLTEPHEMELSLDGEREQVVTVKPAEIKTGSAYDQAADLGVFTFRVSVKAGPREVGVTFLKRPSALSEQDRQPFLASFNIYRHPRMQPGVYRISIAGPLEILSRPEIRRAADAFLFVVPAKTTDDDGCANSILSAVARRAYRRPVTGADLQPLLAFYKEGRAAGAFDDGIERALSALLVSPEFLFRIEEDPANIASKTAYHISDLELASRLSFFLWSSIPDDELLTEAVAGTLKKPAALEKQIRRMLADSRSHALIDSFASQWLQLRNLAAASLPRPFPDFDDNLRQALRRETELFFQSILDEDRSVLDLLGANYTFLNERLARHYGIPNVYGSRFRRVILEKDSPRGGLLGQGSFLTVTSYATRTAPTLRGKWILENILGSPPPAPPPNIPVLKDDDLEDNALSMRARMARHRTNPSCAGCHQMMDPVGFALENFDAVGRWRGQEEGVAVDASGSLPGGAKFDGVAGLRQALLSRPEPFLTTMTGKLLTYALGRGVEYYDAAAIRKIVKDARSRDYAFSSLIVGIVNSVPFQMRMSQ